MQQDLHRKKHKREREKILKQNRLEKLIKQKLVRKRKERRLKVLEKGNELIIM